MWFGNCLMTMQEFTEDCLALCMLSDDVATAALVSCNISNP